MSDLTNKLLIEGVDQEDLVDVVTDFYGFGQQSSLEHFDYSRSGEPYALRLIYQGSRLPRIMNGPGWQEQDADLLLAKVRTDLLDHVESSISRKVLFAGYPVNGFFDATPFFRILPAPPEAPRPPFTVFTMDCHPLVLEFPVEKCGNRSVNIRKINRKAFELTVFLNAVLECRINTISANNKTHWVATLSEDGMSSVSTLGLESYGFESFRPEDNGFSPIVNLDPMQSVEPSSYYGRSLELGRGMQVPDNFHQLIEGYHSLQCSDNEKFLVSAFWLHQATSAADNSSSFLSSIYAIDALVPNESAGSPCKQCLRPQGKSEADKFVQFLEEVAPEESNPAGGPRL